ncbi:hypothetical protein NKR23_g5403 [Pleurostoma richardsiae]|uniref:Uncharacterized protein n=1 Tax=Pleurostoma richardsiae TaxID=41990 RepID=A0AA38VU58_9PEZI|nr:hypothetical protein NKR23_g5403 [Pleurostoma richardsiae]
MAGESNFGSNNPFRRKTAGAAAVAAAAAPPSAPSAPSVVDGFPPIDAPTATSPHPSAAHLPSGDDFQNLLKAMAKTDEPAPSTTFQKKKPVKKVRVQSPPPSSPESGHANHGYPEYPRDDDDSSSSSSSDFESLEGEAGDPFRNAELPVRSEDAFGLHERIIPQASGGVPPPNPFQKTLEDIEHSTKDESLDTPGTATAGKGALDVDAFRRLLLTGQAPSLPHPSTLPSVSSHLHPTGAAGDGASNTDASSISRQSIFDAAHPLQETPRSSHEISEPEADESLRGLLPTPGVTRRSSNKKPPPPPPGSRHGKMIKFEFKGDEKTRGSFEAPATPGRPGPAATGVISPRRTSSSSDVNKPLPPAPARRPEDEEGESIFDREAAGKVPDIDIDPEAVVVPSPRPPTPPNISHSSSTPVQDPISTLRKPAPPPRRQPHARTDSKPPSFTGIPPPSTTNSEDPDAAPLRSSLESTHSRSSSTHVNISAPAPPPPRRATTNPTRAAGNSLASPTSSVSASSPSALSDAERSPLAWPQHGSAHLPHGHSHLVDSPSPGIIHSQSQVKLSTPPPPPPARNSSMRSLTGRPASVSSMDAPSRRIVRDSSGGSISMPPPPPPRARGSSKGSLDGPAAAAPRRTSVESVRPLGGPVMEEPAAVGASGGPAGSGDAVRRDSAAKDILADLDALQREVDALRGQFEKKGGS